MAVRVLALLTGLMLIGIAQVPMVLILAFELGPVSASATAAQFLLLDVLVARAFHKWLNAAPPAGSKEQG